MDLYDILSRVCVINRDDGLRFTQTDRLDAIADLLKDSRYKRINSSGLFHSYAPERSDDDGKEYSVFVVSSHIDCEHGITKCFSREEENGMLRGTYDNAITNAAVLYAMLSEPLPDDVYICFTGDEEYNSHGAAQLIRFLKQQHIFVRGAVVLDVTDVGWEDECDFTIENDFWDDFLGRRVISFAEQSNCKWKYVPGDLQNIPDYVKKKYVVQEEAAEDESWYYDDIDIPCFSFCLPVLGKMHSNKGVLARGSSFRSYTRVLSEMLKIF